MLRKLVVNERINGGKADGGHNCEAYAAGHTGGAIGWELFGGAGERRMQVDMKVDNGPKEVDRYVNRGGLARFGPACGAEKEACALPKKDVARRETTRMASG